MNKHLADSDSDFSEFSSVASGKSKNYEDYYRSVLKGRTGKEIAPTKFEIHNRCKTHAQVVRDTKKKLGLADEGRQKTAQRPRQEVEPQ